MFIWAFLILVPSGQQVNENKNYNFLQFQFRVTTKNLQQFKWTYPTQLFSSWE